MPEASSVPMAHRAIFRWGDLSGRRCKHALTQRSQSRTEHAERQRFRTLSGGDRRGSGAGKFMMTHLRSSMARGSFGGGHVPETDGWRDVLGTEHGLVERDGLVGGIGEIQVGADLGDGWCPLCIIVLPEYPTDLLQRIPSMAVAALLPACGPTRTKTLTIQRLYSHYSP
jgi:hypothetical protein